MTFGSRRPVPPPLLALGVAILIGTLGCGQPTGTPPGATATGTASSAPAPQGSPTGSVAPSRSVAPSESVASASPPPAFDPAHVTVGFATVVRGLVAPLGVVNAGDGSGRLFVAQQGGQIRIVRDGKLVPQPFLDIADRITSGGERGLLGVAFHPGYPTDPRVFVDYTDRNGDTRVSAFRVDPANPDRLDPASEQRLLFVKQPYPNHNGGALVFGPEGDLYIALGDGGSGGDPEGNGQSLTTLLGKILRIDVDRTGAGQPYSIPSDNPYAGATDGRRPEIWLTGLRNPWRMSFDRLTGDLWIGDVGQDRWEEVDVQRAATPPGTNFGWNRMEANHCYLPPSDCRSKDLTLPVAEYGHDQGCTVIGGDVYRGTGQPALVGGYLFADYCTGRVWAIDPSVDGFRTPNVVADTKHNFTAFGEDQGGELYAVDISAGQLLRVTATSR
jgi:glucose/arabinose dehydrogenase